MDRLSEFPRNANSLRTTHRSITIENQVRRLHVSMDHAIFMSVAQSRCDICSQFCNFGPIAAQMIERFQQGIIFVRFKGSRDQMVQADPIDQRHCQEVILSFRSVLPWRNNIRMVQARRGFRFSNESFAQSFWCRPSVLQNLDGNFCAKCG